MGDALVVEGGQSELFEKTQPFVARTRCPKPLAQSGVEGVYGCLHNRLLVEANHPCLAALLTQPNDVIRGHFPFAAAHAIKMTIGALMYI